MNRTIKFRAWDKEDNRMYHDVMIGRGGQYIAYEYTTETDKDEEGEECDFEVTYSCYDNSTNVCAVMQFTGLKDKRGKDVYEGDIMSSTVDKMLLKWEVCFKNGCFGISNVHDSPSRDFHPINSEYYFTDREITGHIYEAK